MSAYVGMRLWRKKKGSPCHLSAPASILPPDAASLYVGCGISQDITAQSMGYMKLSVAQHSGPWVSNIQKHIFFSQTDTSEELLASHSTKVVNRTSLSAYLLLDAITFSQLFGARHRKTAETGSVLGRTLPRLTNYYRAPFPYF